jgi:hypothetical protein
MKHDPLYHSLRLVLGILLIVALALAFAGCGAPTRIEYQHPQYGAGAVEFTLPKKEGYAK